MKKALHKLTLAVLIAAFILTLAGCGSDDTLKKNITGSWEIGRASCRERV